MDVCKLKWFVEFMLLIGVFQRGLIGKNGSSSGMVSIFDSLIDGRFVLRIPTLRIGTPSFYSSSLKIILGSRDRIALYSFLRKIFFEKP